MSGCGIILSSLRSRFSLASSQCPRSHQPLRETAVTWVLTLMQNTEHILSLAPCQSGPATEETPAVILTRASGLLASLSVGSEGSRSARCEMVF